MVAPLKPLNSGRSASTSDRGSRFFTSNTFPLKPLESTAAGVRTVGCAVGAVVVGWACWPLAEDTSERATKTPVATLDLDKNIRPPSLLPVWIGVNQSLPARTR